MTETAQDASFSTSEMMDSILSFIRSHRCYQHRVFEDWATVKPDAGTVGALFHQIQNFCAATRPGGQFPDALAALGLDEQSRLIQEIVESENGHGPELAMMAGYIVNRAAGKKVVNDLVDQAAVEAKLREFSDELLGSIPGYGADGLAVQTREAINVFNGRNDSSRQATIRNLGTAIALEMVSNNHLIPGEKHCLIDSGLYGVSIDEPEMHYLLEHYGEIGAEQQHEKNAIEAVASVLDEETAPLVMEGARDFLDSLERLWDLLDSALLQSGVAKPQPSHA